MAIRLNRVFLMLTFVVLFSSACNAPMPKEGSPASATPNSPTSDPISQNIAETGKRYLLWVTSGTRELTYDCSIREVRGKWVRGDCSRVPPAGTNEKGKTYANLWLDMDFVVAVLPQDGNQTP